MAQEAYTRVSFGTQLGYESMFQGMERVRGSQGLNFVPIPFLQTANSFQQPSFPEVHTKPLQFVDSLAPATFLFTTVTTKLVAIAGHEPLRSLTTESFEDMTPVC